MIYRIYLYITKFIYYGRIGAKTVDYDANCVDDLVFAHIDRVYKFMLSDNTHLVWNSSSDTNLMRKLAEFHSLCRTKAENEDFNELYYFGKELDLDNRDFDSMFNTTKEKRKRRNIAFKKDEMIAKGKRDRYYYLYRKYLRQFWD